MTIYKYYLEIKNRFLLLFFTWISLTTICYLYKEVLLFLFVKASNNKNLNSIESYFIFTDVTELFSVYFKLTFFIANQICIFMLFYHVLTFLTLGLYKKEYLFLQNMFKTFLIYWFISLMLLYKFVVPLSWNFFLSFQQETNIKTISFFFEAKIIEYFDFFVNLYYICFTSFQLLAIITFIINSEMITSTQIRSGRKFFYFGFIVFSTVITPPDIFSQLLISILLIMFYELIIFNKIVSNLN